MAGPAIDLLQIGSFLDAPACASVRAELEAAIGGPATLLGEVGDRAVQPLVRRTTRVALPGKPAPREMAGHSFSTAMLAFSETWIRA
jgi:hypothetical protein